MFKKLFKFDGSDMREKINILTSMGFSQNLSKNALEASNGNVEEATNILLSQISAAESTNGNQSVHLEDQDLQRAIYESKISASNQKLRSAASIRAGEAATARVTKASQKFGTGGNVIVEKYSFKSGNSTSSPKMNKKSLSRHPNVRLPTQMKDKSKEEQIMRCTKRLAPHPSAVDTLCKALITIRDNPDDEKYRKIDRNTHGYQSTLHDKPGALDFLKAMQFEEKIGTSYLVLHKSLVDPALFYLGISALEQMKLSDEYITAKANIQFHKEIKRVRDGSIVNEQEEVLKRASFLYKCPSEPTAIGGALIQISLGDERIMRRFDADDIVQDVLNWIGAHGSAIPEKILSREWSLINLNKYPVIPIDVGSNFNKTLQSIGCWPSAKLDIRRSSDEWKTGQRAN